MGSWREIVFVSLLAVMTLVALLWVIFPLVKRTGNRSQPAYVTAIVLACGFPVLTGWLYAHWGAHAEWQQYGVLQKEEEQTKKILATLKSPEQVVERLKAHLTQFPNSAQGWYLLGRLQFHLGHYPQSMIAFTKAHDLESNNIEYITAMAQALFFTQHHLSAHMVQLLQDILQRAPNEETTLHLLAMNAYRSGQYWQAIHYGERLVPLLPLEGRERREMVDMVSACRAAVALKIT